MAAEPVTTVAAFFFALVVAEMVQLPHLHHLISRHVPQLSVVLVQAVMALLAAQPYLPPSGNFPLHDAFLLPALFPVL